MMSSSSLYAFLIALFASVVDVSAAPAISAVPGLTVKTSVPNLSIDGLENLKITTTIVNTGGETIKLLNDPRGVLSSFPENTFTITDNSGSHPLFNGARVSRAPGFLTNLRANVFGLPL